MRQRCLMAERPLSDSSRAERDAPVSLGFGSEGVPSLSSGDRSVAALTADERSERRTRAQAELVEDSREVVPNGPLAEEQRLGDFTIGLT